jgi:DHA1 family bicyclomycin/chloramphenicol resistance-like MFS transporter
MMDLHARVLLAFREPGISYNRLLLPPEFMTSRKYFLLILILGTLSAIGPFSIDMYLPGFPSIAADLNTTVATVSLSLSSFFIGISAGQLIYGPLLDRFGRKNPLYFGLSLYILASIGCAMAGSANTLIGFRFLQAIGGCAGMVASRAMVRDIFPVNENAKIFSLLMLVVGVSPMIAPTLGGYISTSFTWHYVFIILTGFGVFVLTGVHFVLPESRKADTSFSLRPSSIFKNYFTVLTQPQFYTYVFTGSVASAGLYAYISGSPYVFMELYHVSAKQYGWIFAFLAGGLIASSQLNTLLLKRGLKSEQVVVRALICQCVAGICLFTGAINGWLGVSGMISLIFVFLCCQGFIFPNTSALSLAPFTKNAGSASALMGCIQMGIGALISAVVSYMNNHTALPMTAAMAFCPVAGFLILMVGSRVVRTRSRLEATEERRSKLAETV